MDGSERGERREVSGREKGKGIRSGEREERKGEWGEREKRKRVREERVEERVRELGNSRDGTGMGVEGDKGSRNS